MPTAHQGAPTSRIEMTAPNVQLANAYAKATRRGRRVVSSTAKVLTVLSEPEKPCISPYNAAHKLNDHAPRLPGPLVRPTY